MIIEGREAREVSHTSTEPGSGFQTTAQGAGAPDSCLLTQRKQGGGPGVVEESGFVGQGTKQDSKSLTVTYVMFNHNENLLCM